ncbi:hypothetical protein TOPH_04167, partial [Tolypocladium ophioglossoides CBS 100239]
MYAPFDIQTESVDNLALPPFPSFRFGCVLLEFVGVTTASARVRFMRPRGSNQATSGKSRRRCTPAVASLVREAVVTRGKVSVSGRCPASPRGLRPLACKAVYPSMRRGTNVDQFSEPFAMASIFDNRLVRLCQVSLHQREKYLRPLFLYDFPPSRFTASILEAFSSQAIFHLSRSSFPTLHNSFSRLAQRFASAFRSRPSNSLPRLQVCSCRGFHDSRSLVPTLYDLLFLLRSLHIPRTLAALQLQVSLRDSRRITTTCCFRCLLPHSFKSYL